MINDHIDAIIQRGEERTVELNSKYEGLNLDDLNNFKSDATVQQWEGEDFRTGASTFSHVPRGHTPNCDSCLLDKESFELQPTFAVEARAQDQLFRGQLLQGYAACWSVKDGQGSEGT